MIESVSIASFLFVQFFDFHHVISLRHTVYSRSGKSLKMIRWLFKLYCEVKDRKYCVTSLPVTDGVGVASLSRSHTDQ